MNPLDKAELGNFDERIQKEMPFHSTNTVKIPLSFSQNMPKRVMEDLSVPTDNIFINKYQHIIEEILHRDPNNKTAKEFLNYQNHYFGKYGILKGDGIFHKILNSKHKALARMGNIPSRFLIFSSHVNGADLNTSNGTGGDSGSFGKDTFQVFLCIDSGIVGQFYDRVALDIVAAAGNYKLAVYDGDASNPNNLYQQVSITGSSIGYTWQTVTEFSLSTTRAWTAFNNSANGLHPRDNSPGSASSDRQTVAEAYATSFTTPAPGGRTDNGHADIAVMKTGHS